MRVGLEPLFWGEGPAQIAYQDRADAVFEALARV